MEYQITVGTLFHRRQWFFLDCMYCKCRYFVLMTILTAFTTLKEKNYIVFALEKDKAGMVSKENMRMIFRIYLKNCKNQIL